ncbi:phage protease [Rhodovulum sp. DZ06]|uniref:phage protease n=1 Tax=Rhodovulum sp. DZ06 TaxID=3425126 RepID=UPI003D357625
MTELFLARFDSELGAPSENGAPEWVHLLPAGEMTGRDGRRYVLRDPQALVNDFEAGGIDLPVDYNHQNDTKAKGDAAPSGPIPAAGWIKELKVAPNGIWGRVAWTERARSLIGAKEYRYLSPTFYHMKDRSVVRLKGAGLVHNPNLNLVALASEDGAPAEGMFARLAELLGLDAMAGEGDVFDAVAALLEVAGRDTSEGASAAANAAAPDPSRFVPIEAVQSLMEDRKLELARAAQERAEAKVEDAFRRGYLTTPMREWALALCLSDEDSFDTFINSGAPAYAHLTRRTAPADPPARRSARPASEAAAAVCAQLGLAPDALSD